MRRNRSAFFIVLIIGLAAFASLAHHEARKADALGTTAEVRVLSAVGMRQVISDLGPKFERTTGYRLKLSFDSGGVIVKRLERGEVADVVMINRAGMERLSGAGRLVPGSVTDLATSIVGVAVRKGARKPDISTPEAFRRAMLAASSIACPDPALGGSSGVHIAKVFERLDIAEAVKPKLVFVSTPEQEQTMPGHVLAQGKAEIALHQMQELMAVPGIEIVGPLPGDLQETFVFSAGIMTDATDVKAARALIEFLRTPEAQAVIKAKGMQPPEIGATTVTFDCDKVGAIGPMLSKLKPGDVVLVRGTCQENILIQPELQRITLDGQRKATIKAADARRPAIQVLGREVTIKGFTVTGGSFGIAINRGATAVIDNNTIEHAATAGLEVSHNSFARVISNTIQNNEGVGILVLGSSSVHIGVWYTDDKIPRPNVIQNNAGDGIQVLRSSTARIIGNTFSGNRRNGLTIQQASHADVAGNVFNGNGEHGILVKGNSGVNLADSAMRLFVQPNTTTALNGLFGIRCEVGGYVEGALGTLNGRRGLKDISDTSCIDRSSP